jgi:diacylglycerol O-acyltransferase
VLVKIHHAVADGAAASALLANAMQVADAPAPGGPVPEDGWPAPASGGPGPAPGGPAPEAWRPEPVPSASRLLADAFVDHLRQLAGLPGLARRTARNLAGLRAHRRDADVRPPLPVLHTPRTRFNTALTPHRAFATATVALDDVRAVKRAFGVTLNDVVLAMVAGALRGFLLERGELPDRPLVAGVPVVADPADGAGSGAGSDGGSGAGPGSTSGGGPGGGSDEPRLGGNRVSNLFTTLATDEADPVARLQAIHRVTAEAKVRHRLLGTDTFAAWVQYTPPGPYSWVVRQWSRRRLADRVPPPINLVVSNVPGPTRPLAAAGARLEELYSVGPVLEGIGLNVTVWSYCDRLHVGVLSCREALPEPADVADRMGPALAELARAVPVTVGHRG